MSEPDSAAEGSSETLPEPTDTPEPAAVSESLSDEVHGISIQQFFHQIQLLFPSLVEVIGRVADDHPELAHKIVDDVIKQGDHRQKMEEVVIRGNDRRESRAQLLAWVLAMVALVGAIMLIALERSALGIALVIFTLAPLAGINLIGSRSARQERAEKARIARPMTGTEPES